MKLTTKIAVLGVVAASVGTIAAWAAWNSTVDGTGSAKSTTSDLGTGDITPVTPLDANQDLYPGAVRTTRVSVKNDNLYPIVVTKIYAGSSLAVGDPACPADSVRTDAVGDGTAALTKVGGGTEILGGGSGVYELTLRMKNDPSDNCKSKTFVIGDNAADDGTGSGQDAVSTADLHADVKSAASTANNF